ncbi:CobW family GTP-binding protein [Algibacillus agarilyticus]|uniref:CobW family GTP-binding protein n=1 Tax=Algibacillus agarilyticus TaxID=2234133 RepID=UPI000DCF7E1B|nr:GTP-binding protein [Algibacillus agarilyticus]
MLSTISHVKTNLITGFLGTGKTTAILHLLKTKPKNETWAVLVNEFGDVGLDADIIRQKLDDESSTKIVIKQIAGGCMCCAANVVMRTQLNALLKSAKPDRLLIEPSGLGHPKNVLDILNDDLYSGVLQVESVLTLIDMAHLKEPRYQNHELYQQQIQVADRLIINKLDQHNMPIEYDTLCNTYHLPNIPISAIAHGKVESAWLDKVSVNLPSDKLVNEQVLDITSSEIVIAEGNKLNFDFITQPFEFEHQCVFDFEKITALINNLSFERFKGIIQTDKGVYLFNLTKNKESLGHKLDSNKPNDTSIEIIALFIPPDLKQRFQRCLVYTHS